MTRGRRSHWALERDPYATARRPAQWLTETAGLDADEVDEVEATGWPNETIMFDARWREHG